MKLIIGLGNPDKEHMSTRHNAGFLVLDEIAREWAASFQDKPKFQSQIAELNMGEQKVWLVKPMAFYNLVGEAVRKIRDFYKLENEDILVIHDDMALPFGTIRTRLSGTSAGNNGIKSLNEHLGDNYARIRIGIWSEHRETVDASAFVLGAFNAKELRLLKTKGSEIVLRTALTFIESNKVDSQTSKIVSTEA